jgi:hypothetical protein
MSLLDLALALAGMPEAERVDLEAKIPALGRLSGALKSIEPELTQAKAHVDALLPLGEKIIPVFQQAWPDIVGVTPTIDDLIAFVKTKA